MKQNTKNPVTGNGTGAGSENQVNFTKVVAVVFFGVCCRKIKCENTQAFSAALKKALNFLNIERDERDYIIKDIVAQNSQPWKEMKKPCNYFVEAFGGHEQVFIEIRDAVEVNGVLYVKL